MKRIIIPFGYGQEALLIDAKDTIAAFHLLSRAKTVRMDYGSTTGGCEIADGSRVSITLIDDGEIRQKTPIPPAGEIGTAADANDF